MRKSGKSKRPAGTRTPANNKAPSGFSRGILLGGALVGAAAYFGPSLLNRWKEDQKSDTPAPPKAKIVQDSSPSTKPNPGPQPTPRPASKSVNGIPLFRRPTAATDLAVRAGLGESYPGSLRWKKTDDLGWNAFASLTLPSRGVATPDPTGDSITALFESNQPDHIEKALLTANLAGPRGESETLEKFRALALTILSETGCPVTRQLVDAIGVTTMETETPDAAYSLKKITITPASRWELSIRAK